MPKRYKKENPETEALIDALLEVTRNHGGQIWRDIAKRLSRPSKSWSQVNVGHIEKHREDAEMVAVPGKVLGAGELKSSLTVGAVAFSKRAREAIEKADGRAVSLLELAEENPTGSRVKIIG